MGLWKAERRDTAERRAGRWRSINNPLPDEQRRFRAADLPAVRPVAARQIETYGCKSSAPSVRRTMDVTADVELSELSTTRLH